MYEMSDSTDDRSALSEIDAYDERAEGMLRAFDDAQFAAHSLQTIARDPSLATQQRYAAELLALLVDHFTPPVSDHPGPESRPYRKLCHLSDRVNGIADQVCRRLTPRIDLSQTLRWIASFIWFACALGAAVLLSLHLWLPALLLLVVRFVGAIALGTSNFPADIWTSGHECESGRSRIERCLLSHAGDVAVSLGVAGALIRVDRGGWAVFAATAGCVTLLGSLARVGVFQVGVRLERRKAERLARRFPAIVAVALTALLQPTLEGGLAPLLAAATLGSLVYALLELYCVHRQLVDSAGVSVYRRSFQQPPQLIYEWTADRARDGLDSPNAFADPNQDRLENAGRSGSPADSD